MTKLPDKLAARRDGEATAYELATGPVGYRNGFNAGAAEVLAMAERLVEALRLHDCAKGSSYFDGEDRVVAKCSACEALEAWKGDADA